MEILLRVVLKSYGVFSKNCHGRQKNHLEQIVQNCDKLSHGQYLICIKFVTLLSKVQRTLFMIFQIARHYVVSVSSQWKSAGEIQCLPFLDLFYGKNSHSYFLLLVGHISSYTVEISCSLRGDILDEKFSFSVIFSDAIGFLQLLSGFYVDLYSRVHIFNFCIPYVHRNK